MITNSPYEVHSGKYSEGRVRETYALSVRRKLLIINGILIGVGVVGLVTLALVIILITGLTYEVWSIIAAILFLPIVLSVIFNVVIVIAQSCILYNELRDTHSKAKKEGVWDDDRQ